MSQDPTSPVIDVVPDLMVINYRHIVGNPDEMAITQIALQDMYYWASFFPDTFFIFAGDID